ncbi:flagellar hook-associated protein FlgL [Horticoccus sp. 23ND18S-11]|uniref:flagellar hook-associated protein FlgL n=1 Tax=Horticoccus sp. 23ND18S-11 TaxID=3391832 RepID=UPI0039C93D42
MRLTSNTLSENIIRQIQALGAQQAKLQTQVATGQRIFQPEDDPTAVGRVLGLESSRREITQYLRNADRAREISETSFSGLQQLKRVSDRATEIGTLGSGAISPEAAGAYASEVDQMIEQALQVANGKLRNDYMFAGTAVDTPPFTATRDANGKVTGVTYAGNSQRAAIQLSESASVTPSTTGATNTGIGNFLNELVALRDALTVNNSPAVVTAQTALIASEDVLVSSLAEHGGVQMRIEANRSQLLDRSEGLEKLISSEADLDLPTTIVKLNQSQTAYQAALSSSANIMRLSLLDYIQ